MKDGPEADCEVQVSSIEYTHEFWVFTLDWKRPHTLLALDCIILHNHTISLCVDMWLISPVKCTAFENKDYSFQLLSLCHALCLI